MARKVDVTGIKLADVASLFSALKGGAISAACLRLDATINDKKKIYIDKVGALMSVLENVLTDYLSQTSPEQTLLLFEFLHRHTLNLVLHGDWGKHNAAKLHMRVIFTRFEEVANKRNIPVIQAKIKTLLDLFPDPWGNSTLTKIMNNEQFRDEEALNFIKVEMGVVLIVRLEIMAEARLDIQALRLIEVCLRIASHPDNAPYFEDYTDEIVYIRDIYLILLVRTKNSVQVYKEVGQLGLTKTLELVQRCVKGDRMVRLKKSRLRMADFVANIALIIAMMHPITEENVLYDLMEEWVNLHTDTQTVFRHFGNMARCAMSSQHIYLLGLMFVKKFQFGGSEKSQCIELYIRALTVNLNEVQKHKSNSDQEKLKESEVQLSNGFLLLADYLKEDLITCRECVLTAFSLNPTKICYEKIKDLAISSGKLCLHEDSGSEDNCENNQSTLNCEKRPYENQELNLKIDTGQLTEQLNGSLLGLQDACDAKEKQSNNNCTTIPESDSGKVNNSKYNFSSPIHISDAQKLGVPQTLFDDLATVISSARYQVLNWNLDWSELSTRCESYLLSGKEVRSTEKELKYLNIDYSQFKDWPNGKEYDTGIEKGFEQCVKSDSDEESNPAKSITSKDKDTEEVVSSVPNGSADLIKEIPTSISLNIPDSDSQPVRTKRKIKRKALLPVSLTNSDSETKDTSISSLVDTSTRFVKKLGNKGKKSKVVPQKPNPRSILTRNQPKPVSLQLSVNNVCDDVIDLASIEEDAWNPPSPISISAVDSQTTSRQSKEKKPKYCIAENDLISPFSSPSKLSDPTVLKSLRMYRAKKSSGNVSPDEKQDKRFNPMLSTIDLNPRILSRPTPKSKSNDVITIDIDSEPEIIDLVDDDDDDDLDCASTNQTFNTKHLFNIRSKMKINFEDVLNKNSLINKKSAFSKPSSLNDLSFTLGLKSLDNIRPPTSETTVQVVQLSNSTRPSVTSNSSTGPATTMIFTMTQQSGPVSHGHGSNSTTTVIYSMPQQTPIQVPSTNVPTVTTVIYTMPHQSTSLVQGRTTTSVTSESSSKPIVSSNSLSTRALNVSVSQINTPSATTSTDLPEGTPARQFFTATSRQVFSQPQGYSARQSPEQALYNTPMRGTSPIRTPSPHDLVMTNPTLGVIRVERYSLFSSSESNQSLPNLSPIKSPVCTRPQTSTTNRQIYMRSSVTKTSSVTSQSHSVVTSPSRQTILSTNVCTSSSAPTSTRSMPVTAHIQRVGYPPESSQSQSNTGIQMKYIVKDGTLSASDEKQQLVESESDSGNVSIVLSPEQIQQLLPKSLAHKEKTSEQDDTNSAQGASLPKFQQAFGRTMYQNSSTPSNNVSLASINEPSQLNFAQQMQSSSISVDTATSASICTVLSKAVQTSKSEISGKTRSNNSIDNSPLKSLSGSSSTSSIPQAVAVSTSTDQVETQLSSNFTQSVKPRTNDRPAMLSQTPVKIFCKVPVTLANTNLLQGKSVAILKAAVTPEKLSQTQVKYEVDNKSKETVIRSNMSALLAAALQAQPHLRTVPSSSSTTTSTQGLIKSSSEIEKKKPDQSSSKASPPKNFRKVPVVHQPAIRYTKPVSQVSVAGSNQNTVSSTPVMTIPIRTVLTSGQQTSRLSTDRIEVRSEALVSSSAQDDSSGSSLLDQQLKEFESVFNKVKKTSQMKERTNSSTVQNQSHLNLNQQILLSQPSSSSPSVEFTSTSTNQTALFQSTSTSTIHDLQGERVSLTFINQPTSGATNTLIASTSQKITTATPVVVVQSCNNPVASPALSVTSQSSLSPAPPSTPGSSSGKITNTTIVKQNKSNKSKTTSKATPTTTLKLSTLPKPQQKPQEDEQTTQRIYAILDKYAEQLRNSPELKNKPAPRRRSNPPTNPSQNSKRKKSTQTKSKLPSQVSCSSSGLEMSPGSEDMRTIGSEDSSNGVSQLSQTMNSPPSRPDNPSTPTGGETGSETSESLDSRDTRIQSRLVLTETQTGQSRTVIVQDNVPNQILNVDASKLITGKQVVVGSQTIVPQLVLPNVTGVQKMQLFPVPADGRPLVVTKVPKMYRVHQVTMPRGTSALPLISTTNTVVFRPMCGTPIVKQVKLPGGNISTQSISNVISAGTHSFTLSQDSALDSGEVINLDNAILLNSTSPQSISFVHRSIPSSSYQNQDNSHPGSTVTTVTSAGSTQKTTVAYSTSDLNVSYLKQEPGNTLSMCSSINVIPVSSNQDTKSVPNSSNITCINIDDDNEYSTSDQPSATSQVPTLVVSQSNNDNSRWRSAETITTETSDSVKKENISEEFCSFQSTVKTMMGHRTTSAGTILMSKPDRFTDIKKSTEKGSLLDNNHDSQIKDEDKPERILQEPELCEDNSVSSDSAGSGRMKNRNEEKPHLLPETSQDTGSPWPYNVTKIECIVKSESPNTSVKHSETENDSSLTLTHSQESCYKKKTNNTENTIYQMAFKRSDRSKTSSKELESNTVALERDLRLQKSLSEDCEDLGVDEPSTSDLFPEAELLLDPDHSSRDSQLDLPSETFSQTVNSSSSCDSREMSPMFPLGKRPTPYRSILKSQSATAKTSRFVPIYNPNYQFSEESTSANVSSTRADSPECQIISYKLKGNKLESNYDSSSPCMTKSLVMKDPIVILQHKMSVHDQNKSSSSGASTPINGGESAASPNHDEIPNNSTSEETQKINKVSKDTEVDTSDSDSNTETINLISSDEAFSENNSFIPIPNPAASSPFTYAANRSNLKRASRKNQTKHEIWRSMLKDSKEDIDSDMSDLDQVRLSDKRSSSTDEDLQSEGETRAKNGLGEQTELLDTSEKLVSLLKTSRKRSGSLLKCSSSKTKVQKRPEPQLVEELLTDLPTSTDTCQNAARHHDTSSRRSSLRGHIKKNCPCCNGSQEKPKSHVKSPQKSEKVVNVPCPSSSLLSPGSNKKKQSRVIVKSSHITKKR